MKPPIDRFMEKVTKSDSCWIWSGTKNTKTRRAYFKIGQKNVIAARWLYSMLYGEIGRGFVVMHLCDNPECVNPSHLRLATQIENIADRDAKKRNRLNQSQCVNGHSLDGGNVRHYGPDGRWRMCKTCSRDATRRYRAKATPITRLEAENYQ